MSLEILAGSKALNLDQPEIHGDIGVFDTVSLDFVNQVSMAVLKDSKFREFPEFIALAFWFRKSNLLELSKQLPVSVHSVRMPRGTVFHLAPSNVDTVVVYSWFLSVLCGNANIVRLSKRRGPGLIQFIESVSQVLQQPQFRDICNQNVVVTYGHEDEITTRISRISDVRVLWGGDSSVMHIRSLPSKPGTLDLPFPTRVSSAVLRAQEVRDLNDQSLGKLAELLFNDAFWFGQQACSSPISLFWVGSEADIEKAKTKFWCGFSSVLKDKGNLWSSSEIMDRVESAFHLASENVRLETSLGGEFTLMESDQMTSRMRLLHHGNGLFVQRSLSELDEISKELTEADQTLGYFGWKQEEIRDWILKQKKVLVDRVVPIGNALNFAPVWDGKNMFEYLTRSVWVE